MTALGAAFGVAALLLALAGALKLLEPGGTARALQLAGLPGSPALVRLGGAAEVLVGAGALAVGGRLLGGLVALSYLGFAGFVVLALRRRTPISTCGCLGRVDTPPSWVHVVVDLACTGVALVAVVRPEVGIVDVLPDDAAGAGAFLVVVVAGTALAAAAITVVPRRGVGTRRAAG